MQLTVCDASSFHFMFNVINKALNKGNEIAEIDIMII